MTKSVIPQLPTPITRRKRHRAHTEEQPLLPGLPDHVAHLCLALLPPSTLYSVCRSWRRLLYSPSFPPFLSLTALSLPSQTPNPNTLHLHSFDPISSKWSPLPPPPTLRFLFRHQSFISRNLPIQTVAVSGKLLLLAATDDNFLPALPRPLLFDSLSNKWIAGPPLSAPRRWCVAGASRGVVFVASGIGAHYSTEVARSVERLEPNGEWHKIGGLKDGKFSREAIDAVGWRGKLCMVNVKGDAAKEGIVYDVESNCLEEMPVGMLGGWRGPAAAMDEETIYVVDESRGALKAYDHVTDAWVEVVEDGRLKGAQQAAAAAGKVCVLSADGGSIVVVDVAAARLWVVEVPPGFQALAVHILPRSHSFSD